MNIIGRISEIESLTRLCNSSRSEFLMVYGRRRVGKTFLIREFFNNRFAFSVTGIARGNRKEQLTNFYVSISRYNENVGSKIPEDWFEAFHLLEELLTMSKDEKKVVFLDELPWMDTPKSDFVKALELFWNSWASARHDIFLIVCGSAASWLVKNIVRNHGGLHNRLTFKMKLQPFNLWETKNYLNSKGINWENSMIAECYMILGGIPYYLDMLDRTKSLAQNVDALFFSESALLQDEYQNLYASLFKKSEEYIHIVETLAKKKSGYTRDEIIRFTKLSDGGGLTRKLEELEQCCFIRKYKAVGDVSFTYQLIDFFSLFYHSFLKSGPTFDSANWMHLQGTSKYHTWCGLSFERLCMSHLPQIKKALGISGISTNTFAFYNHNTQIDMVIDRGDQMVSLCEMKYTDQPFSITKAVADNLKNKIECLKSKMKKRKGILVAMITTYPLKKNQLAVNMIQNNVLLDDLFCL
ncbi:MAG: ATP-binding protein [Bacteroidaceae bacterium]|nr:ATP-binding protein [Bacteroidaceae bacterium]